MCFQAKLTCLFEILGWILQIVPHCSPELLFNSSNPTFIPEDLYIVNGEPLRAGALRYGTLLPEQAASPTISIVAQKLNGLKTWGKSRWMSSLAQQCGCDGSRRVIACA